MRKLLLLTSLTFFLLGITLVVESQDSVRVVNFRVIDDITGKPVELAHIINAKQKVDAIADLLGYFRIPLLEGDSLSITSIGYFSLIQYCWGQYGVDSVFYEIRLKPRSYPIKEVKVNWFSTYDKFIRGVAQFQIPLTEDEKKIIRITEYFDRSIRKLALLNLPKMSPGMLFGKDFLMDQKEKLDERLEKERKQRVIGEKFNAGIVSSLTGLGGNEVHWFMEYCAFNEEYLLATCAYDITIRVLEKFKVYTADKISKEKK